MDEHYMFAFPPFMPPNPNGYKPYSDALVLGLELTIRPYLPETMHEFTCSYDSVSGKITVSVKETDDEISLHVDCADGIRYQIDPSNLEKKQKKAAKKIHCSCHIHTKAPA